VIVIDASIAVKWIMEGEDDREKAQLLYQNHYTGKEGILVPDLIFLEVANSLVTKSKTNWKTIRKQLNFMFNSNLTVYCPKEDIVQTASKLAQKYHTSVYDMLYAVIARKHKTVLVTADERFVSLTKFPHVKLLSKHF